MPSKTQFTSIATSRPQALGRVLEQMGFHPIARHRSREVLLYRQGNYVEAERLYRRALAIRENSLDSMKSMPGPPMSGPSMRKKLGTAPSARTR